MGEAVEDMRALADKIAGEMGDGWSGEDGVWPRGDAFLTRPDGVWFHLRTGGHQIGDGRVRVSGVMPQGWHDFTPSRYNEDLPQDPGDISMTLAKTPAAMAREIGRRLLPGWTAYYGATRDRKAAHDARDADVAAFGDRLVAAAPGAEWRWSGREIGRRSMGSDPAAHPGRDTFGVGRYGDAVRAEVRLTSDGATVELDIRDRDAVASLFEWIAARRAGA